jgi:hypothetical protein
VPIGDRALAHLLQSDKIGSLVIGSENTLTDQTFAELAKQPCPQYLQLSGRALTDKGLATLEGKELTALTLQSTSLTDDAFAALAKVNGLTDLTISDANITGSGIPSWPPDQRLESLTVSGNPITTEGIKLLAKANCAALNLTGAPVDDELLMLFAGRDDMNRLDVTGTKVTSEGVKDFYEARNKRHKASGVSESLILICDFPEIAERYYDLWGATSGMASDDEIPFLTP